MGQGFIDVPLTTRQRSQAPTPVATAAYEDVPLDAAPDFRMEVKASDSPHHTSDFFRELWQGVNPIAALKSLGQMVQDPKGTAVGMLSAQGKLAEDAKAAFEAGDYVTGTRKFLNYLVPILGPGIDRAGDLMVEGKTGAGLGATTAIATQIAAPELLRRTPAVNVRTAPSSLNAAERSAVDFGMREGIPVDAATATGNRFVRGTQKLADESLVGSAVGSHAAQQQAAGLTATGERLAARAHPSPVMAEQAGQGVRDAVTSNASVSHALANTAYERLRALEAKQAQWIATQQQGGVLAPMTSGTIFTKTPFAVDVTPTKAAMLPVYEALKKEAELAPASVMGSKARALVALDKLMSGPDMAPLSVVDAALGDLKTMARAEADFRRTPGQGIAAEAVTNLDRSVVAAAKQAGPDVFKALMEGRAATVNKYKTLDVLDALRDEPVKVFQQLTANKDTAINLLRDVKKQAPAELPKIGRAYLEGLMEKATAEGGFSRADGVFRDWQNLGAATKRELFQSPALIKDLDDFFLLAKRMSTNPNPSGTALTWAKGAEAGLLMADPMKGTTVSLSAGALSKLLHSPRAVKAMVRGLRVPLGNRAAAAAATTEIAKIARDAGIPLVPVPASADQSGDRGAPQR